TVSKTRFCSQCGAKVAATDRFCSSCGHQLQ
ncbi:MAG: zinc ribbon domain-containing protein, partial [Microcystis sp. LE19-131.1A]